MDVKMIVSDLDGTLLDDRSVIADRTAEVLRQAVERGVVVVAATGRSVFSALPILRPLGTVTWALCSNGASSFHLAEERLVQSKVIPAAAVSAFVQRVTDSYGEVGLCWETEHRLAWDEAYQTHRDNLNPRPERQEGRIADFPAGSDLVKLLITHPEMSHDDWLEAVGPMVGDEMFASTSGTDFVELTHATATKGQTAAELCQQLGVERENVVAFGDQMNDLDLLQWAGRGYAMANASDAIKAVASHEAPHHAEHGVAQVLETLLGLE